LRSKSGEGVQLLRPYPLTPTLSPWERELASDAFPVQPDLITL
jgi:hypothetical protein